MKVVVIYFADGSEVTARGEQDLAVDVSNAGDLLIVNKSGKASAAIAAGHWTRANVEDSLT